MTPAPESRPSGGTHGEWLTPGRLLLVVSGAAIAIATLTPLPQQARLSNLTPLLCLLCGEQGSADFTLNMLLFVPLGLALGLMGLRPALVVGWAAVTTLGIETAQLFIVAGRDAALGDVIANTTGGTLGYALNVYGRALTDPQPPLRFWLGAVSFVLPVAAVVATLDLLTPDLPDPPWYTQWSPRPVEGPKWFGGTVESVSLNDIALPWWEVPEPDRWRNLDEDRERISLSARVRTPGSPRAIGKGWRGRIASIGDRNRVPFLTLATAGTDLRFGLRTRSANLLLRTPTYGIANVLSEPDTRSLLEGSWEEGVVTVGATNDATAHTASVRNSAVLGWTFLLPGVLDESLRVIVLSVTWIGCLFIPLGYYVGVANRGAIASSVVAVVASLGLTPYLMGGPQTPGWAWLAAIGGILTSGVLLRRLANRGGTREVQPP